MTGLKDYLFEKMKKETLHITLLDPEKLTDEAAREIAVRLRDAGTDAFMIGGSTGVTSENLGSTAKAIREAAKLPTIYFPSDPHAISDEVDGMFFMTVLNSTNPLFISHAHAKVAARVKKLGIECIPMAYIVIEPGMTVGHITQAELVKHNDLMGAVGWALAAEYLGQQLIYLEAGSGANEPVSPEMIRAVKNATHVPIIVGGGIHTPAQATAAREAGANIIVTGTFVEKVTDGDILTAIVHAAKGV